MILGMAPGWLLAQTPIAGTIATNSTWSSGGNPYQVFQQATVAAGVTLKIDPGVVVQISNGVALNVQGRIEALGTATNTIRFTAPPTSTYGGSLRIVGSSLALEATGMLDWCAVTALSNEFEGAIFASNAYLTVSNSLISNVSVNAIMADESRFHLVQNTVLYANEGLHALACAGVASSNVIRHITGLADAIDMDAVWSGSGDPSLVIEWNVISDGPGPGTDGIDYDGGVPTVRYNIVHDMEDCGIIFGGGSQGDVYGNLVWNTRCAMAIDDGSAPVLMNNTFVNSEYGVRSRKRYFATGGRGGITNSIVWGCATNIDLDTNSTLDIGYCNVQGMVWPGPSNLSVNPGFISTNSLDYRLTATSPCIDRGRNLPLLGGAIDLDFSPRQLDTAMDMGAFEFTRSLYLQAPAAVSESGGWLGGTGRVTLSLSQATNVTLYLQSSQTQTLAVTSMAGMIAGQTNLALDLTLFDDELLNGARGVTVTVSATGYRSGSAVITVTDNEIATLGLDVPAAGAEGGATQTGRVWITALAGSVINVSLTNTQPTRVITPPVVSIQPGATSALFTVQLPENGNLDGSATVTATASVAGWSNATALLQLADNEATNLRLSVISEAYEGDGVISPVGSVQLGGTAVTSVAVSLLSSDTNELVLPSIVIVPPGTTSATFSATFPDDGVTDGDKQVTINVQATGLSGTNAGVLVRDNEVQRLDFNIIGGTQTAGVPIAVTVQALAANGGTMSNYSGQVALTAGNGVDTAAVDPESVTVLSNGTWQGSVTVLTVMDGLRLHADDGAGSTGDSNPFDALAGVMDHFSVENADSQRFAGKNFPLAVVARDTAGNRVPNYEGAVSMWAASAGLTKTNTFLPNTSFNRTATGTRTLGLRFSLSSTITVTHVRSFWGSKVSIWTDAGQLVVSKAVSGSSGQWTETALDSPLTLNGGSTYRVGVYGASTTYYYRTFGTPLAFSNGVISEGCNTASDAFPGPTNASRYLVDFRYTFSSNASVSLQPGVTPMFLLGAWTGGVVIAEQAPAVTIHAADTNGYAGASAPFNVGTGHIITVSATVNGTISPSGEVGVVSGSNKTFTIQADPGYLIGSLTTNGVAISAATGKVSHALTWSNVLAGGTLAATFSLQPVITNLQAFNDLAWQTGDLTANITTNSPVGLLGGSLRNYASGQSVPASVLLSVSVGPVLMNAFTNMPLPPGSDAYNAFNGRVSCSHYAYWSLGTVSMVFSNLVTTQRYSFALFGSRGSAASSYSNRWVDVVISDVSGFVNASTPGAVVTPFTSSTANDGSRLLGANVDGSLVRYDEIQPGSDGDIVFTLTPGANVLGGGTNSYINAFMLAQTTSVQSAHVISVTVGTGGMVNPTGQVAVSYGADASFTVQATSYWHVTTISTNGVGVGALAGLSGGTFVWSNVMADGVLTAGFAQNVVSNGVPESWLAGFGLTNGGFEAASTGDVDGDGAVAWEEYIAGTVPTNPGDAFQMGGNAASGGVTAFSWVTATGRYYSVIGAPNWTAAWTNVATPGFSNAPGTGGPLGYTNPATTRWQLFRVKTRLAP